MIYKNMFQKSCPSKAFQWAFTCYQYNYLQYQFKLLGLVTSIFKQELLLGVHSERTPPIAGEF